MANQQDERQRIADAIRRVFGIARIAGIVVIVVIAVTGVLRLIEFYSSEVGLSAPTAAATYVQALLAGDLDTVYAMTDEASLTDLYGAPVSRTEFMAEARALIGDNAQTPQRVDVDKLWDRDDVHYYQVTLTFSSGVPPIEKTLWLRLTNQDGAWRVAWPFGLAR